MPPTAKPTAKDEDDFMKYLLADLDHSFYNSSPSSADANAVQNIIRHDTNTHLATPRVPFANKKPSCSRSPSKTTRRVPLSPLRLHNNVNATMLPAVKQALKSPVHAKDVDMAALFEGAEDWDLQDIEMDDDHGPKLQKQEPHSCSPTLIREPCTRCVVQHIHFLDFSEKRLTVKLDGKNVTEKREIVLKQDWVHVDVAVGDVVNVLGKFIPIPSLSTSASSPVSTITITSHTNMLILHPDLLLSATTVANAPACTRKPLVSALLTSNAPPVINTGTNEIRNGISHNQSDVVVWGNFLHEVMQRCLKAGRWDKQWIEERIEEVVMSPVGLGELVKLGVEIEKAKAEVRARAGGLEKFAKQFVGKEVKSEAILADLGGMHDVISRLALTSLHDVEEDIWSPTYGLKGKLDASTQVLIERTKEVATHKLSFKKFGQKETHSWTMPFEIKTGRSMGGLEHRAQTMLYTLLVAERYGVEVPGGLLYYTQSAELMHVSVARNELKGLIMARNELASYMMRKRDSNIEKEGSTVTDSRAFLPATIDDDYKCTRCYAVNGCMLYRKAVEEIEDTSSVIASLYAQKTSHLTTAQCEFFKKWEALISLEEQEAVRFRKELWTLTADERERAGRCFAKMVVQDYKHDSTPGVAQVHRHLYRFTRARTAPGNAAFSPSNSTPDGMKRSLLSGSIFAGDAIVISIEPDLLAIARGFVVELEAHHIVVGFDHEINLPDILKRTRGIETPADKVECRIDKDEFAGGMGRIRDNLARLFYVNGDRKRLSLVVDLSPPAFDEQVVLDTSELPEHLNLNQQDALRKVLSAKDYAIILGMPGTGKTTTIAEIINVLVKRGKTVLLASYTHSAVDTILLKLNDADYPILRLGNLDKVHPDVRKHTLAYQPQSLNIEQLENQILGPPVVATTCLSVDHALFARRYFDFCFIDEASQITLPTCLGALRYADKFVLVGDHFQLPPLVRSRSALAGGFDVSLFRRLIDAHPEAVIDLVYQYRMNEDIMLLSNKLIYGDRLRCASKAVATRALVGPSGSPPKIPHTEACQFQSCWIEKLLHETCKAVFIDTDLVPAMESREGDLVQNEIEAKLILHLTEALLLCGISQTQIGIISLYRQQIKLLSHLLEHRKDIELLTADKSQGRDKDCIIASMVRSNDSDQVGSLIKDWRRINVSFTRARAKLIIFGSRKTLSSTPVLVEFFNLMEDKGWIISLPPGAERLHIPKFKAEVSSLKKRAGDDSTDKENRILSTPRKTKKAKVDHGVLRGRPLLQDLVNDVL